MGNQRSLVTVATWFLVASVTQGFSSALHAQPKENKPLEFTGRLETAQSVEIRSRVTGFLTKVQFRAGDLVKQGDLLFQIDATHQQLALQVAEAELRLSEVRKRRLEADVDRLKKLVERGVASREELDSTTSQRLEAAERVIVAGAQVTIAQVNLAYTKILSPMNGVIGMPRLSSGNLVRADDMALAEVLTIDSMYLFFDMDERTLLRIHQAAQAKKAKLDQVEVTLRLADGQEYKHKGRIDFVDNRLRPETGTILVRATFANPERQLRPGMAARVFLPLDLGGELKK